MSLWLERSCHSDWGGSRRRLGVSWRAVVLVGLGQGRGLTSRAADRAAARANSSVVLAFGVRGGEGAEHESARQLTQIVSRATVYLG